MQVEKLLDLMERNNFLYPAKKEKLAPLLPAIKKNLTHAFSLPDSVYRTLTFHNELTDHFASIASWKYSSSATIILHLVSNHPVKTREIFFYHILKLAGIEDMPVQSILTYYQPKTRFAHRMFTHIYERRVDNGVMIEPFHFYAWQHSAGQIDTNDETEKSEYKPSFFQSQTTPSQSLPVGQRIGNLVSEGSHRFAHLKSEKAAWTVKKAQVIDLDEIHDFLSRERGELYIQSMDLNSPDLELATLDDIYRQYGLSRRRQILLSRSSDGQLAGMVIINRGSVGLHFSQIENAVEFIGDSRLPAVLLNQVLNSLMQQVQSAYSDWELPFIPLLVHSHQASQLTLPQMNFQRQYNLMICSRANFVNWFAYLMNEYENSLNYQLTQPDAGRSSADTPSAADVSDIHQIEIAKPMSN